MSRAAKSLRSRLLSPPPAPAASGGSQGRSGLLEAALAGLSAGIAVFDEDLRLVHCNPQMAAFFGIEQISSRAGDGRPGLEALLRAEAGRSDGADPEAAVLQRLTKARAGEAQCEERVLADGRILEFRGVPLEGRGYMIAARDVTEARRSAAMIVHMAQHDVLTGLPNRLLFADRLDHGLAQVRRGGMMAVHYLDLDAFKPVNDNLGHQGGDELLALVAARMRGVVREGDTLARLGGDEFGLVQSGIRGPADAEALAMRLQSVLAQPYQVMGEDVRIGASFGIALAPVDGSAREPLLRSADLALYRAKRSGGGICFFSAQTARMAG